MCFIPTYVVVDWDIHWSWNVPDINDDDHIRLFLLFCTVFHIFHRYLCHRLADCRETRAISQDELILKCLLLHCYPCILPCYACIFDVMKETLVGIRAFFVGMRAYWRHERALFMTSVLPLRSMKTKCWRSKADWGSDVPCTLDGIRYCASAPRSPEVCVVHRSAKTELGEF